MLRTSPDWREEIESPSTSLTHTNSVSAVTAFDSMIIAAARWQHNDDNKTTIITKMLSIPRDLLHPKKEGPVLYARV